MNAPVPPLLLPEVRTALPPAAPLQWLALGWRDLWRSPLYGLAHGLAVAGFGALLLLVARERFWLLAGAFSGFLVVAPVVATGLYAASRALEHDRQPGFGLWWQTWRLQHRERDSDMVRFGLLLALAGTGWVLTSAALITLLAPQPVLRPMDFVRHVVLAEHGWLFELWLALGALMAAPIFASSVVSMPLLVDRRTSLMVAVLASWRCVLAHPVALALWAATLAGLVALGFATAMLGLVVVIPWLGHASWHAYRALLDSGALPPRPLDDGERPS